MSGAFFVAVQSIKLPLVQLTQFMLLPTSFLFFLSAQTIEANRPPVELPVVDPASGRADHCEVAVNSQRDFLVVWHCEYDPLALPGQLRTEGIYGAYDPVSENWVLSQPLVLGEPRSGTERCHKPAVIAIDSNDFAVTWARLDAAGPDRVEAVVVRNAEPGSPDPFVERPAWGEGYLIEDGLTGEPLGILPELVWTELMGNDEFAIIYNQVTEDDPGPPHHIEAELRWAHVKPKGQAWSAQPSMLVSGIPIDGKLADTLEGSRGVVDALFVQGDRFCVAWEQAEYVAGSKYRSSVQLRLCDYRTVGPPQVLQSYSFEAGVGELARLIRRPKLMRSPLEQGPEIAISCFDLRLAIEQGFLVWAPGVVAWELNLETGATLALPIPVPSQKSRMFPVPVTTLNTRALFFSWFEPGHPVQQLGELHWSRGELGQQAGESLSTIHGRSPAVALHESTTRLDTLVIASQVRFSIHEQFRIQLSVRLGNF